MRYLIALIMIMISLGLSAQIDMNMTTPEGSVYMSLKGMQEKGKVSTGDIIDLIAEKLDKLEKEVHVKLNKIDQKRAENLMIDVYNLLSLLPTTQTVNYEQTASGSGSTAPTSGTVNINMNISGMDAPQDHKPKPKPQHHEEQKPPASTRKAISETEFNSLVSKIKAESFADDQMRVLRTAAKNYRFNCNQIIRIIGLFNMGDEKLDALRIAYPEVTDPANNYKILDAFTFSDDKEAAEDIINP